jgi:hypothetical protein
MLEGGSHLALRGGSKAFVAVGRRSREAEGDDARLEGSKGREVKADVPRPGAFSLLGDGRADDADVVLDPLTAERSFIFPLSPSSRSVGLSLRSPYLPSPRFPIFT